MPLPEPLPEQHLLHRLQQGDAAAFQVLYQQTVRYLTAVCSRYIPNDEDVRDVLQDSYLHAYSALPSFAYRGEGSLRAWLVRIVVNESLLFLRRTEPLPTEELTDACADIADDEMDTESIPSAVIYESIRALPTGYRTVFNLFVIEGKSHQEIAALLHIKESSSASQLHHAKVLLAARLRRWQQAHDTTQTL